MPAVITFFVLSLAVWRISYMLVWEEGPYDVFGRIRTHFGIVETASNERSFEFRNIHQWTISGILTCVYCMSVWIGLFFALLFVLLPTTSVYIALPFAFSAVAMLLEGFRK